MVAPRRAESDEPAEVERRSGLKPATVQLPTSISIHTMENFLQTALFPWPHNRPVELVFPRRYSYIAPVGSAMLAAWGDTIRERGAEISCSNLGTAGIGYASRIGLFDFLGVVPPSEPRRREEAGRFIALRKLTTSGDLKEFAVDALPLLHLDSAEALKAVRYCIEELVRNVLEHAGPSVAAYACAQYYPSTDKVSIAVADCGRGLLATLKPRHKDLSSCLEAAHLALRDGVSGAAATRYGSAENAGLGLHSTRVIAKLSGQQFVAYSGDGGYLLLKAGRAGPQMTIDDPECDSHKDLRSQKWPGTVVALDIGVGGDYAFTDALSRIHTESKSERLLRGRIRFRKRAKVR